VLEHEKARAEARHAEEIVQLQQQQQQQLLLMQHLHHLSPHDSTNGAGSQRSSIRSSSRALHLSFLRSHCLDR
jgi:hypothetical protein